MLTFSIKDLIRIIKKGTLRWFDIGRGRLRRIFSDQNENVHKKTGVRSKKNKRAA